jgi:hypothetical protein
MSRWAIVTMRVPLREDYPWKAGQPEVTASIENHLFDALQYEDYVEGKPSVKVVVVHTGAKDAEPATSTSGDQLGHPLRDS